MKPKSTAQQIQELEWQLHRIKDNDGLLAHAERVDIYRKIKVLEGKMPKK